MDKKKVIRKKFTQDDAIRLTRKQIEALDDERELSEATMTSIRENSVQFLEAIQSGQSRGGKKGAETKRLANKPRNEEIRNAAKELEASGRNQREIPTLLQDRYRIRHPLSVKQIKRILKDE